MPLFCATLGLLLEACTSHKPPPTDAARPEMPPSRSIATPSPRPASTPVAIVPMPRPAAAELRGVWISDPRGMNWPQVMSELRNAGFNAVFVNFNTAGAAFYPSRFLPNVAARDEIRLCLSAARHAGIQVHAKFIVWYAFQAPATYQKRLARENRLLRAPNGQILVQGEAPWLNPAAKLNRDERLAAIREALQRYPVSGVQLDYIRYPDNAGRITLNRRNFNTQFVIDVRDEMKRLRPGIPLSVANFYDYPRARNEMGQDWVLWAQTGAIDVLCPMNYTRDTSSLEKWIQTQQSLVNGRVPLYCGLGGYMLASPRQLNEQIAVARRCRVSGFVVFAYNDQFRQQLLPGIKF